MRNWASLVQVAAAAVVTLALTDLVLHRIVPYPPPTKEVEDAVREYAAGDPTLLVIGSSHARSFDSVAARLEREAPGAERIVALPVELGKLASYQWVLDHRIWPLADERDASGALRRPGLRRVILVTEWWDSCDTDDGLPSYNLPARAWTLGDFVADVEQHGITSYNRNYVRNRWTRLWERSLLVRDRGHELLLRRIRGRIRAPSLEAVAAEYDAQTAQWQRNVEHGVECIGSPVQMKALSAMLDDFARRGLETTILLYPRKPGTLTDAARAGTLPRFSAIMKEIATSRGLRFIDLTTTSPLSDAEFAEDFDHLTGPGHQHFAAWALDGSLSWLRDAGKSAAVGRGTP